MFTNKARTNASDFSTISAFILFEIIITIMNILFIFRKITVIKNNKITLFLYGSSSIPTNCS